MKRRTLTGNCWSSNCAKHLLLEILISKHKWVRNAFPFVCFTESCVNFTRSSKCGRGKKEKSRKMRESKFIPLVQFKFNKNMNAIRYGSWREQKAGIKYHNSERQSAFSLLFPSTVPPSLKFAFYMIWCKIILRAVVFVPLPSLLLYFSSVG